MFGTRGKRPGHVYSIGRIGATTAETEVESWELAANDVQIQSVPGWRAEHLSMTATQTQAVADEMQLLAQTANGDRAAFEMLYARLAPRVFGLVLKLVRDHAQSEEVTQEIFLEIWQQAPNYDPRRGLPSSWMMTIAHRRAVDRIRSSQASHQRDLKIGERDYEEGYDTVADTVETTIAASKVRDALSRLTEFQRTAVELIYYRGLTQQEAADRLSIPVGTVKTRLRDGLIRLRDELGVAA